MIVNKMANCSCIWPALNQSRNLAVSAVGRDPTADVLAVSSVCFRAINQSPLDGALLPQDAKAAQAIEGQIIIAKVRGGSSQPYSPGGRLVAEIVLGGV